ncbi:MAG: glycosyltransferase family 2 protein [Chitinophagales bacterium]
MISFVLPAYNEEANLPPLLEKIAAVMAESGRLYRVVAVNDGSRDRTPQVLSELSARIPIEVVTHPINLGLPQTILDGLRYASQGCDPGDIVITMDADNTHEPRYALELIRRVEEGCDVAIASRYRPGAAEVGLSAHRRFLSKAVNVMLAACLPIPGVRDYTCGYRAYRASLLQQLFAVYGERLIESTTFSAMAEILLKAGFLGLAAGEIPLVLRYDQKAGASKMRVVRTILDYLRMIASLWLRRRVTLRPAA